MEFDFDAMAPMDRYDFLLGTVVPRPIAIVTTLTPQGTVNAAPYSLFNVMGHDPAVVAFSVLPHPEGRLKDTANNIQASGNFVLNLVSEEIAEAMNLTCIDAPPGTDELQLADLKTAASSWVSAPRIAASPVALECFYLTSLSFGPNQAIIFGRVAAAHVDERFVRTAEERFVDTAALKLIGAMHGARWYARLSDRFAMDRPTWAGWKGRKT